MKFDIFSPKTPSLGLQLNGNTLKWMQFDKRTSSVRVKAYTHVDLPKNVMSGDTIIDSKALSEFIAHSFKQPTFGSTAARRVTVTIPESKSFVRIIHIPKMSELEIDNTVLFEAEAYIPLPMDQVYFDWQLLGVDGDRMEILIIASPKDIVDHYVTTLEAAGLRVIGVEVESQSVARALIPADSKETLLIVDLDVLQTNMIMIERGNLQFTSSIPLGGNMFDKGIVETLGVEASEADKIKKQVGIADSPEYPNIKSAMLPVLNNLSAEIKNIIKFHYDHSSEPIKRVILSGGTAKMKNLPEFLTEQLKDFNGVIAEIGNPWKNIKSLQNPPLSEYEALGLTATIGVAMRGLL